ncbi:zinc finger protein 25-like isoform X2 [Leguminivora glycinivorella]|uniref:zinc finger protein 25-like isoform X2 n=1 Tax=Leguminivora glycinivorella TaxID=1035111 RepID=UPI00200C906D|nr:zinc finger protein 25-like isoform X2 [Leguminivora glycinivorella]
MDVVNSCRCCLKGRPYKDLATPYTHLGKTETYVDMLIDCFDIHLDLDENISRGICLMCVSRLRDASDFKLQVQHSQTQLHGAVIVKVETSIKSEPPSHDIKEDWSDTDNDGHPYESAIASSSGEKACASEECNEDSKNNCISLHDVLLSSGTTCQSTVTQEKNNSEPPGFTVENKEQTVKNFMRKTNLKDLTVKTLYNCKQCSYKTPSKSKILRHQKTHTKPLLSCDHCSYKTPYKYRIRRHQNTHAVKEVKTKKLRKTLHKCDQCSYTSVYKSCVVQHQMIHTNEKPFMCDHCAFQCRTKKHLIQHMMKHTEERPFKCSMCTYKCKVKTALQSHEKTHTGEKPYKCSQCDYKCITSTHLKRHAGTHPGNHQAHKCSHCDYHTHDKSQLKRHVRVHTNVWPYKCDLCDYQCRMREHLRFHQMKHTGEKPHKCSYCDFRCIRKSDLPAHLRTHTGEKPYKCKHCTYECRQKHVFEGHMKFKHPDE